MATSMQEKAERLQPTSLYRSRAGIYFYGTENEIWAGFRPVGNTEKKMGADYEQLLMVVFFHVFRGKIIIGNFFKNILASELKSCIK